MLNLGINDGVEFLHEDVRLIGITATPEAQIKTPKSAQDRQRFWLSWFIPPPLGDFSFDAAAFCLIDLVDVFVLKPIKCRLFQRLEVLVKRIDQFLVDQPYPFGASVGLTS